MKNKYWSKTNGTWKKLTMEEIEAQNLHVIIGPHKTIRYVQHKEDIQEVLTYFKEDFEWRYNATYQKTN